MLPQRICIPVCCAQHHSRTIWSRDADTTVLPSGEKATARSSLVWPSSVCRAAPVPASHSRTVWSLDTDITHLAVRREGYSADVVRMGFRASVERRLSLRPTAAPSRPSMPTLPSCRPARGLQCRRRPYGLRASVERRPSLHPTAASSGPTMPTPPSCHPARRLQR